MRRQYNRLRNKACRMSRSDFSRATRHNNVSATYMYAVYRNVSLERCVKITSNQRAADPRPIDFSHHRLGISSLGRPDASVKNETHWRRWFLNDVVRRREMCHRAPRETRTLCHVAEANRDRRTRDAFPSRRIHPVLGRRRDILGHGNVSVQGVQQLLVLLPHWNDKNAGKWSEKLISSKAYDI